MTRPSPILMLLLGGLFAIGCADEDPLEAGIEVDDPLYQLVELRQQGAIPAADVNQDGQVNIVDLIIVAQNFGQDVDLPVPSVEVVSVEQRATQTDDISWNWAWKLTARNNGPMPTQFDAMIDLLDVDGFIIDQDSVFNLTLQPFATKTFTGRELVFMPWAANVVGAAATIDINGAPSIGDAPGPADLRLDDLAIRATTMDDISWNWAWQATVTNIADGDIEFTATVKLLDVDGFIVDQDRAFDLFIAAGGTTTFTGVELVFMPEAESITQATIEFD